MGAMGSEYHNPATGWIYITQDGKGSPDFRYRRIGNYRFQAEVWVYFGETIDGNWENFGVFKDMDDLYAEIELSRAEPRNGE